MKKSLPQRKAKRKSFLPQKKAKNTKEGCLESPSRPSRGFAAERFFLPFQRRWIMDESPKRFMVKSRQIGISLSTAYDLVRKTQSKGNAYDAWVSSRDDLQAQLFGADCANWARLMHSPIAAAIDLKVIDPAEKITAHVLPFQNGRSIYSLSSNPNAQAGKRGRRVVDEFALNAENRLLYAIGQPGTMWGGGMDIISTHRGTGNYFNELLNEIEHKGNPKGFSLHRVTILDAVREGLFEKIKAKWAEADAGDERLRWKDEDFLASLCNECADEESWQQEFLCQPGDDDAAFLSYDLIASCEYGPGENWESGTGNRELGKDQALYVGVDVGRTHDLTVIWVVEKLGDVRHTRAVHCLDKQTFDAQEEILYGILHNPAVRRCCIDQSGLGRQFAERAIGKFGEQRVEGIAFTGAVKEELAYPVKAAFEDRTVRIPSDRFIRADLRSLRKTVTAGGNIRFEGERTQEGHADRFWALALALQAAKETTVNKIFAQLI